MTDVRTNRRLAAILAADVVGYSRMMGLEEAGTLAALKHHRETVFNPTVAGNNGRMVKLIGDGTLVEFTSVVDAVKCALAVQAACLSESVDGPRITLRIGINLGDVIIDGEDIYGDGVNVAARLEPLAEPGGICVSSIVNESVGSRAGVTFADGGEVHVKNIDRPIRVWKWHPGNATKGSLSAAGAARPSPAAGIKPSIAVLPFTNMSGDPDQEYFSDGISEDIITDLSKIGGLRVIARNSTFIYKGKAVDIRSVGRDLGCKAVLEGSIRKSGSRVRITAQLIEADSGEHLWAERYDRELTDIFEVQDDVTRTIVEALKVTLSVSEKALLSEDDNTSSVEAHDLYLRGRELIGGAHKTRERFEAARKLLERAIQIDPNFGNAFAALAQAYGMAYNNAWLEDVPGALREADALATKAVSLSPMSSFCWYTLSMTAGFSRDLDRSKAAIDKALELSPNSVESLSSRGIYEVFAGDPMAAIPYIEQAVRLDPIAGTQHLHFLGLAHLLAGNYETAVAHFRERILLVPETDLTRALYASALGHLGENEEAERTWHELKQINPQYSLSAHMARLPFRNPEGAKRITDGLAKAGLPD